MPWTKKQRREYERRWREAKRERARRPGVLRRIRASDRRTPSLRVKMAKYQQAEQERVHEYLRAKRERIHESRVLRGLESFEGQKSTPERTRALRKAAVKRWRKRHPDRVRAVSKEKFNRIRMEVIYRYSFGTMSCECCGWDRVGTANSLEVDHVGGGGSYIARKRRDTTLRGIAFLYDLRKNFQPEKYRVLCRACNAIIEPNKPHCVLHEPTP